MAPVWAAFSPTHPAAPGRGFSPSARSGVPDVTLPFLLSFQGGPFCLKRARVKEHRLSSNTISLVCRLPRAQEANGPPSSSRHLLLKRRCTPWAAEAVGLSPYHLRDRRTSRDKDAADRILDHLVFALWQPLRLPVPEFPERAAQEEVEDDQQDEDEDDSIHSGRPTLRPQSYGTVLALSTEVAPTWLRQTHSLNSSNGLASRSSSRPKSPFSPVLPVDRHLTAWMLQ